MEELVKFFSEVGKLKERKRRGWLLHQIKNPETTASHIFRVALISWLLSYYKKELNLKKILKMALIHDICEVYAGDETPYDPLVPKNPKEQKKIQKILDKWPKFTLLQKKEKVLKKYKKERMGLEKIVANLPRDLRKEILSLWEEFEKGLSKEGRFVRQVDKVESYLQGMEYWKRYGKIRYKLWARWAKEIFDDPLLLEFIKDIEKIFHSEKKPRI